MDSDQIKGYFLDKIKNHDFKGFEGSCLNFHIPVQEDFLNFLFKTLIDDPEKMNDFEVIQFSEMNDSEFKVKVDHKMIKKEIRCRIHDFEYIKEKDRKVEIEFLDGIKFYEKALLNIFRTAQSGWSAFKNALKSDDDDENNTSGAFWKISGSKVKINLDLLLRKQNLAFLVPLIDLKGITTKNNSVVIDFELKTTHHESNHPANN